MLSSEESKRRADRVRHQLAVILKKPCDAKEVTCEERGINDTCDLAFDPYNTDGDCLMEK